MSIIFIPKNKGGKMGQFRKNLRGKTRARYCPVNKTVWQQKRDGSVVILLSMPTYGLDREEIPNG